MVRKNEMWDLCGKIQRKEVDLEDPTPLLNEIFFGCTQREAEVDHHAVQAKADLFRRITSTEVTDEKKETTSRPITAWSYDTERHAEKCVEKHCELAGNSVSA